MGKVLSTFGINWPGSISRAVDDVVISLKNVGSVDIPFGAPVFMASDGSGAVPFNTSSAQAFTAFLGFAVRDASKTPDTYPSGQDFSTTSGNQAGAYKPGDTMDILVRGTIAVITQGTGYVPGASVLIKKADGKIYATDGGTSSDFVTLSNVKVRRAGASGGCSELVVTERNIQ